MESQPFTVRTKDKFIDIAGLGINPYAEPFDPVKNHAGSTLFRLPKRKSQHVRWFVEYVSPCQKWYLVIMHKYKSWSFSPSFNHLKDHRSFQHLRQKNVPFLPNDLAKKKLTWLHILCIFYIPGK